MKLSPHVRDGYVIVAPVNQRVFEQLADAIGHPEWKSDAPLAEHASRAAPWGVRMAEIEQWTHAPDARRCEDARMKAGVPCSR